MYVWCVNVYMCICVYTCTCITGVHWPIKVYKGYNMMGTARTFFGEAGKGQKRSSRMSPVLLALELFGGGLAGSRVNRVV